jgi:hypothetical protein
MSQFITKRVGSFQPFTRLVERDGGTSVGAQYGVITYDNDDNYRISHIEIGFRCDHLHDAVAQQKSDRSFDDAAVYDCDIISRADAVKAVASDVAANPAPVTA